MKGRQGPVGPVGAPVSKHLALLSFLNVASTICDIAILKDI